MITEAEQQDRLAELRAMRDEDIGSIPLLDYEIACQIKANFWRRLWLAREALRQIEAEPDRAREIAQHALEADRIEAER